jgi:hypothetical protein
MEGNMKAYLVTAAIVMGVAMQGAFADTHEPKTRAQVRQELIEAQKNGLRDVSNASYPAVARIHEHKYVKTDKPASNVASSGEGPGLRGTSESGQREGGRAQPQVEGCVGPASFCNIYFGS